MMEKASKLNSISDAKPQLASHYEYAQKGVFGYNLMVSKVLYPKFRVMEDDLRFAGVDTMEYAYTVTTALEPWAKKHGFKYIPINTFLGDWALAKFLKIYDSKTITILKPQQIDEVELLFSEEFVARRFIDMNLLSLDYITFSDVVAFQEVFISTKWLELYETKGRDWLRDIVLTRLCFQYKIQRGKMKTYADLLKALG